MFVPSGATILHADLDAFYASVEQRDDRRLRGRPVIVGGGVVLAASYEARAAGVHSAMGGRQARRLCPEAIVVEPRWTAYVEASRAVFRVFERTSPLVEGLSIDEAFLDVRGLERIAGSPAEIAADLRRRGARGGGPADHGGRGDDQVPRQGGQRRRQAGRPAGRPGRAASGPSSTRCRSRRSGASARRRPGGCARAGIATVGQVARLDETALVALLGPGGRAGSCTRWPTTATPAPSGAAGGGAARWGRSARGTSPRGRPRRSTGRSSPLADRVARRTRRSGRVGRTVVLRLRFGDYTRAARSRTLPDATADTRAILAAARELLDEARPAIERRGLTLLGIALTNLDDGGPVQLVLPIDGERHRALDAAVDRVRERFGTTSLTRASLSGEHRGLAPWLPPD